MIDCGRINMAFPVLESLRGCFEFLVYLVRPFLWFSLLFEWFDSLHWCCCLFSWAVFGRLRKPVFVGACLLGYCTGFLGDGWMLSCCLLDSFSLVLFLDYGVMISLTLLVGSWV